MCGVVVLKSKQNVRKHTASLSVEEFMHVFVCVQYGTETYLYRH